MVNRRMMPGVRFLEEKESEGECKNQILRCCHHWDEGGRDDLTITMPGRDDAHTNSAACTYMVLSDVQWQPEREEAQLRMQWQMM